MKILESIKKPLKEAKENYLNKYDEQDRAAYQKYFEVEAAWFRTLIIENPKIAACDPLSLLKVLGNVVTSGLTLSPALKECYVVPYKGKTTLIISYIGMIRLLTDAGTVSNVESFVVYENDVFEYELGLNKKLRHVPALKNRGEKLAVYAIAHIRGAEPQVELLTADDITAIKNVSQAKFKAESPWNTFEGEMWRKSSVKRLFKYLPKTKMSDELIAALSIEHLNESNLIIDDTVTTKQRAEIFKADKPKELPKAEPKVKAKKVNAELEIVKPDVKIKPEIKTDDINKNVFDFKSKAKKVNSTVQKTNGNANKSAPETVKAKVDNLDDIISQLF